MPSVDEVLRTDAARSITETFGRNAALHLVRRAIETVRSEINGALTRETAAALVEKTLVAFDVERERTNLTRVVNATGVIVHTNLGRSRLSDAAIDAISMTASGYCNVELELRIGERGRRGLSAEKLLAEIAVAEDGLIVNNCAAATLLTLSALAEGGEVVVSRGELVEIGGDFRIPEVLERSGCRLREVGTTNRTKLSDYERAIGSETKAILRVHPSNYRITGFTEKPQLSDLSRLARGKNIFLIEDAGSGALLDLSMFGLHEEPIISDSISAGADVVTFSGDKLVGGVQAGLIVGRADVIKKIRRNPLYRALRADKLVYAGVEATLRSFARDAAVTEIPTLRMLAMGLDEIEERAANIKANIDGLKLGNVTLAVEPGFSAIGGGTGPGVELPTKLISISHKELSENDVAAYLRSWSPPIIARIQDDRVVADLRTMSEADEAIFLEALLGLSSNGSPKQTPA